VTPVTTNVALKPEWTASEAALCSVVTPVTTNVALKPEWTAIGAGIGCQGSGNAPETEDASEAACGTRGMPGGFHLICPAPKSRAYNLLALDKRLNV
jgi:hypothetical protein